MLSAWLLLVSTTARARSERQHLDFLEIGTSSFNTLLQATTDDMSVGLSVDMMRPYLDRLPNRSHVTKVHAAIGDVENQTTRIFFVHPEDIVAHNLPWWMRGCNMLGRPHPDMVRDLEKANLLHLQRNESVTVLSFAQLLAPYHIRTIRYLKLDVEGYELRILRSLEAAARRMPSLWPHLVSYEATWLTHEDRLRAETLLKRHSYLQLSKPEAAGAASKGLRAKSVRNPPGSDIPIDQGDVACGSPLNKLWVRLVGGSSIHQS